MDMSKYKNLLQNWNFIILILLSLTGIVLDGLKLFPVNLLTSFLLLLICTFTINQIISNSRLRDLVEELKLSSGNTKPISIREYYSLLNYYVNNAERTIDGTYHQSTDPTSDELWERTQFFKTIDKVIRKKKVRVRRIVTINSKEKYEVINKWVDSYNKCPNLHIRYSKIIDNQIPPPLSTVIIDNKIALIAGITEGYHVLSNSNIDLLIEGFEQCGVFQKYYDKYWEGCLPIKEGNKIFREQLDEIQTKIQ